MAKKLTQLEFKAKASAKHGNKYDYSNSTYVNGRSKITYVCPEHGEVSQIAQSHLIGKGCKKCNSGGITYTKSDFIKRGVELHGDKYDYSKVIYLGSETHVDIICKIHGKFSQSPKCHLTGKGCRKCADEAQTGAYNMTTIERNRCLWINEPSNVYLVRIYSENEIFYKIGITVLDVSRRLSGKLSGYKYLLLCSIKTNRYDAFYIEQYNIGLYESYKPKNKFSGHTECFSLPTGVVESDLSILIGRQV